MPPGEEGSAPGDIADVDVPKRPRRRIFRRSTEKTNPGNLEFERQVAAVEARHEQQRLEQQRSANLMGTLNFRIYWPYVNVLSDDHVEDGEVQMTWNDVFELSGPSATLLLLKAGTQQGKGQLLKDSAKPPDSDFLDGTFLKINSDKQKSTRNKKSSKNKKKKKGKGKGRKQLHASEMQSDPPTEPSSTRARAYATVGEAMASSSSHVATDVPRLEYNSSSSSSPVTEVITIVSGASSGNEKEQSSSSNDDFKSFDSSTSYATATSSSVKDYYTGGNACSNTKDDYAGSLSDARSKRSLSASESRDSRGFNKKSGEGNKPNDHQSVSIAIGPGCSQKGSLCGDYASNDGDFQKVISRKAAQKMKRMQRLENPTANPTPTKAAASVSVTVRPRAFVQRAPRREVITIGHYITDDCFHGKKSNHKKGKNEKGPCSSNVSKSGHADGESVPGGSRRALLIAMHPGEPSFTSRHHTTLLEAIEEITSPDSGCLPMDGELKATAPVGGDTKNTNSRPPSSDKPVGREEQKKAMAPVGDDTEDTDSKAPSSDKTLLLGHQANSSCLDREEQKKAMATVGDDTEDTDSKAPSYSDKTSLLGHQANSSCLDREEQKKAMAPDGDDTEDSKTSSSDKTLSLDHLANSACIDREEQKKAIAPVGAHIEDADSRAPSCAKTSSLGHLDSSSCVDREEQKKAMSPVGDDTKDTDSRAPSASDKTSSLVHLASSSCVDTEEQKKEENRLTLCTHASPELDKVIKSANDAYEIQAASDVYNFNGIHTDIESFLHSATPVIGPISCTTSNTSLQDQSLWSVWTWYEEAECCGIDVKMLGSINSSCPKLSTYFLPSLSAVQLFQQPGKSGNKFGTLEEPCLSSTNHGGVFFEYFELENPFSRPPFFTKIKQLIDDGVNLSGGNPIFGDPKQLESVKLSDLHPASWFCVAWYPICQIPESARKCEAAFLTYHSLGKLVPQTCSTDMAGGLDRIICPIVGLIGYKDQNWLQLGEQSRSKLAPDGSSETKPGELLNKRLRTLRHGASIMSKAVVPKASGEAMNYHSDYQFFWSRSQY